MNDDESAGLLPAGSSFGPYAIVRFIDAGGMGDVYLARDTRLERDVALKLLRPHVTKHAERLARFEREARVLAALSHPRIAALYGIEESGRRPALVMEFVEGPTLAHRIALGPVAADEASTIARQIAEGLEYAHERGVVHRDLKPANIKVSDEEVKILDFGLAKALDADPERPTLVDSPTLTWMATRQGVILGTAAYMAPEQAKGKTVDRRADIWAFGCVLYEMLTGAPAFRGETTTDILAAVVREEPDWTRFPPGTPAGLVGLIQRCLRKDVRQRLQAIGEARITLDEIASGPPTGAPVAGTPPLRGRRDALVAAAAGGALVAVAAGVLGWMQPTPPPQPRPVTRFTIALPPGHHLAGLQGIAIAVSDDGRQLAYLAAGEDGAIRIYLRAMEGSDARAVAGTENATNPFFSPDGRWLGFLAAGKLQKVPVSGGAPHVLADVTNSNGAAWTGAHTIAFAPLASPVQEVSDQGGTPTSLTRMEPGETLQGQPRRLPDEAGVLFGALTAKDQVIALQLPGGSRKDLVRGRLGGMPQYSPSGHLVFVQGDTLMALPFDLAQRAVKNTAPPVPVARGVLQFALSLDGTLAYIQGRPDSSPRRLVWVSRGGVVEPLNAPPGGLYQPRLSPDGRRVALDIFDDAGRKQVGVYDIARDTLAPFTFDGLSRHPIWTRDSRYLLFQSSRDGTQRIYRQPSDGSGEPLPVTEETLPASAGVFNIPYSVSSDGVLTYTKLFPTRTAQVWVSHPTGTPGVPGGNAHQFLETDSGDGAPQLSPDGRWLAYASAQAGRGRQIYVRAFPGPGGPWQVSMDGGNEPQWNPRGGELFFRNGRQMVAVDVDTRDGFRASKPRTLFEGEFDQVRLGYARANYDVSPDGQRFLMLQKAQPDPAPPREIHVVLNWSEELSRLARPQP